MSEVVPAAARPVIGVSCYVEAVDRDPWRAQLSAVIPRMYLAHVERAGGLPIVLPPPDPGLVGGEAALRELAAAVLDRVDGLVIAGGADVEAGRYAAAPHPTSQSPRPDRDAWEIALVAEAGERDLPLLGICRGMQVMAVAAGGVLDQHLPDSVGSVDHLPAPGVYASHPVRAVEGSRIAGILGTDEVAVPTYHHQGVATHPGYAASAWHPDGTLKAMEDEAAAFRIAVQWHPEAGEDGRLFEALVVAARAEAATGSARRPTVS